MKLFLILVFIYFCYKLVSSLTFKINNSKENDDDIIDVDYEEIE